MLGAVGAVSDDGSITLDPNPYESPDLARIELKGILENLAGSPVADLVSSVSGAALVVGAVGALSEIQDPCSEPAATRVSMLSHLGLELTSPAAGALITALTNALPTLTVDTSSILGPLTSIPLLGSVINAANINVAASVAAADLLQPIPGDGSSTLTLDAAGGVAYIDLATLFAGPYPAGTPGWLNNLPPNTSLFASAFPATTVTIILDQWVTALLARLGSIATITVTTGSLTLTGTLAQFANGTATFTTGSASPMRCSVAS
nr:choice-of-anchor G family protein [Pseudoclavibacter helvolus]